MIDFSTLKGLTIPEGVVKQITDSAGRVLWKASQPVTITLTGSANCYVDYKGARYTAPATFEADIGDEILIETTAAPTGGVIYLNGEQVASSSGSTRYTYDVACDVNIDVQEIGSGTSIGIRVYITEIPEGHALVQITGEGLNNAYKACVLTVDGAEYASATTLVVPIGTVITCAIATQADGEEDGYVKVNGTNVLSVPMLENGTYDYTVTGNVTINMSTVRDADKMRTGYITITEQ